MQSCHARTPIWDPRPEAVRTYGRWPRQALGAERQPAAADPQVAAARAKLNLSTMSYLRSAQVGIHRGRASRHPHRTPHDCASTPYAPLRRNCSAGLASGLPKELSRRGGHQRHGCRSGQALAPEFLWHLPLVSWPGEARVKPYWAETPIKPLY